MSTNIVIFYEIKSHLKRIFKNYFRRCKLIIIFCNNSIFHIHLNNVSKVAYSSFYLLKE